MVLVWFVKYLKRIMLLQLQYIAVSQQSLRYQFVCDKRRFFIDVNKASIRAVLLAIAR